MKTCTVCGKNKPDTEFYKAKHFKSERRSECKDCHKLLKKQYRIKNAAKIALKKREYYQKNKIKTLEHKKIYYEENKECISEKEKVRRAENPLKYINRRKQQYKKHKEKNYKRLIEWRKKNPERVRELDRRRDAKILSTPGGRLNRNIARGIHESIKKGSKNGRHWESLVGFTIDELVKHLEKQFDANMSWENQGSYWHIDHILPKAIFNFDKPEDEEFNLCWALKNLRPLEAKENLRKAAKIDYDICGMQIL